MKDKEIKVFKWLVSCVVFAVLLYGILYSINLHNSNDDTCEFPPAVHFRGSLWIGTDNTDAPISLSAAVGLANTVDDMKIVGEISSYTSGRPTIENQSNDNLVGYSIYMSDSIPNYIFVMTAMLSKAIADALRSNSALFEKYDKVIVYYDNGQIELTKILTSVFNTLFTHVEFRKVHPVDYKLFQIADLVCTMELLAEKGDTNNFSHSEYDFFGSPRNFRKEYLKNFRKKQL